MNKNSEKRLLLPHELARVLNVSVAWVYNHAAPSAKVRIPAKRVGSLLRFDLDEVMDWLQDRDGSEAGRNV